MSSQEYQQKLEQYKSMRMFELKDIATGLNIKGRSIMRKQQLIDELMKNWQNEKIEKIKCKGLIISGNRLIKCENVSDKKYCIKHEHRYRLEKPDDCPICMDEISESSETPLECGHWIHKNCLIPTNLHICPVCRQDMKLHEVEYIFGSNHQQHNRYSQNFVPSIIQDIIQIENINLSDINISDYNNQEHFMNDFNLNYDDDNGIQYYNDFEDGNDEPGQYLSPFQNITNEQIRMIIQEIETRPRTNPFVTIQNNLTEIPQNLLLDFTNFIERQIEYFGLIFSINIDNIMMEQIMLRLRSHSSNESLLSIYYNLTFVPHIDINIVIRIQTLIHEMIQRIIDELTFNN